MLHNALTNYVQLLNGFRRALGEMGGDFSGIERAGETLTPILNPWSLPEWALLRGEILFARSIAVGALAANYSIQELVNPTGSGVLAVVLEIMNVGSLMQTSIDSGPALGVLATNRGVAVDARFPQLGEVSRCTVVSGQVAGAISLPQDAIVANTRTVRPYILQPGKKLYTSPTAVNTASWLTWFWSERTLLPNEQNP